MGRCSGHPLTWSDTVSCLTSLEPLTLWRSFPRMHVCPALYLFVCPALYLFVYPALYLFIQLYVCLFLHAQNDRYTVGGSEMFDTLTDLMEFYKRKGIEEISGNWVHFKQVLSFVSKRRRYWWFCNKNATKHIVVDWKYCSPITIYLLSHIIPPEWMQQTLPAGWDSWTRLHTSSRMESARKKRLASGRSLT